MRKCDRCTKFFEPYRGDGETYHSNFLVFSEDDDDLEFPIDWRRFSLCKECMKEACDFMRGKLR